MIATQTARCIIIVVSQNGGSPKPEVFWYQNNQTLDDLEVLFQETSVYPELISP